MNTTPLGPFVGINNRAPAHQLQLVERGRKTGDYLRNAVNVDLTSSGTIQRRPGVSKEVSGSDAHSLWSKGGEGYFVDGDTLFRYPNTVVKSGLVPGLRVSYDKDALGRVLWSNGVVIEAIKDGVSSPLVPPSPNPTPVVTAHVGGGLPAGVYQVAIAAVADGIESAPTYPQQVSVFDGGRIEVSGLSGAVRVYVSAHNGSALFLVSETTAPSVTVSMPAYTGNPTLNSVGFLPLPPGHIVRVFNGRTLVASGETLFVSEPYSGLYNPMRGFIPLPERITICEPCDDGVYIVAEQTYWLAGKNPLEAELAPILPYGATEGTGGQNPDNETVFWFSKRGMVAGAAGGKVSNLQENTVAVDPAIVGAMGYREQNGLRQLVASVFGTQSTQAAASSFADAEVIRKESML